MTKTILHYETEKRREMNNDQMRYQILKTLYDRYYDVDPETHVETAEVIKEAGLESEEKNLVDGNIGYLKGNYLEGLGHEPGSTIPLGMKINTSGIGFVEERNQEYREYHEKLRFKILANLYEYHYSGNAGKQSPTKPIADLLGDNENEKHHLLVETLYLGEHGFIRPLVQTSGVFYPRAIMIESYGIETVEGIF